MANGRARKGGEVGLNGEFYEGGKFLPNTQLPKRSPQQRRGRAPARVLVEPGVFASMLGEGGSVFARIQLFVRMENGVAVCAFADDHASIAYYFSSPAELHNLIASYNAGERFL